VHDLVSTPDWFDKDISIRWGMAAIALAFGVDYRELWPATVTGATKADASMQHLKARGKTIGQLVQDVTRAFNAKFLPPHLEFIFDFMDDEQDAAKADIMAKRSEAYERYTKNELITGRVIHEKMLSDGTITSAQFETMELECGRLEDGSDILSMFSSRNEEIKALVDIGIEDPRDIENIDADTAIRAINNKYWLVEEIYVNTGRDRIKNLSRSVMAALDTLRKLYIEKNEREKMEERLQLAVDAQNSDSENTDGNPQESGDDSDQEADGPTDGNESEEDGDQSLT